MRGRRRARSDGIRGESSHAVQQEEFSHHPREGAYSPCRPRGHVRDRGPYARRPGRPGAERPWRVPNLRLSSASPGELTISWDAPDPAPSDYRVIWAEQGLDFLSYRLPNEANRGNEYPSGDETSITLTDLAKGETFKVMARTRYTSGGQNNGAWSGPWTETITTRVKDDPPAASTGLTASRVAHDSVTLTWTAPSRGTVTGYRVLRGTDANSLSAIAQDTGNAGTEYTDSTVAVETTYFYAVLALSQNGDGAQSAAVSATTPAAPGSQEETPPVGGEDANSAPTASNGAVATNEDTDHAFAATDFNYSDSDGDTLASVKITELPAAGKGTLTLDGTAITSTDLPKTVTKAELDDGKLKYTPPANANGLASFKVKVNDGSVDSTDAYTMTINVTAVNDDAMGTPAITGGAQVGETLTASTSGIADADGLPSSFTYQWKRFSADGTTFEADIGTDSNAYTLTTSELDARVKVEVSFTDNGGSSEGPLVSAIFPSSGTVEASEEEVSSPSLSVVVETPSWTVAGSVGTVSADMAGLDVLKDPDGAEYTYRIDVLDSDGNDVDSCESNGMGEALRIFEDEIAWVFVRIGSTEVREAQISASCATGSYTARASVFDATGAEVASASAEFEIIAQPPAPTGLNAARLVHDSVTLSWTDPQNASITGYRVLRGTDANSLSAIAEDTGSAGTEYTDSTVAAETTYFYAVLALSQDKSGAQSTTVSATTPPPPPGVVFEGVMVVESGALGDGEALGYALRGGGLGSFEITSAEDPRRVGGNFPVMGVLRMPGVHTLSEFGTFVDAVTLMYSREAPTPFVLTVGGREFASSAAVGASDIVGAVVRAWFWERRCAGWEPGDTVAVSFERVSGDDPRLSAATDVASLGSLSVAGARLAEPFDAAVLDYTADAAAETTQVTVAAEAADNNTCGVEISPADADPTAAGHQVDLPDDGAVVTVTVTAADGVTTGTYTLTVSRGGTRPAAAARLNLQGVPDLGFDPGQRRYQVHTPRGATSTQVDALGAAGATVVVFSYQAGRRQVRNAPANGTVPLSSDGDTLIATRVSTPRNERQSIYTVKLIPPPGQGSGDATRSNGNSEPRLSALTVSPGTLTPAFAAATLDYTVDVAHTVEQLTVTATASTGTSVVIASPDADPGTAGHQIDLNAAQPGGNAAQTAFLVIVTTDTKIDSYTVTVTRAAPLSEDATLGSLGLSAGTLDPVFSAGRAGYTAEVATTDARITVTAVPVHASASATITPADADTNTAGHQIDLTAGANTVTVTVTAADGATTKAYELVVTRDAAASADATLSVLSLSEGALSPALAAATTVYSVEVGPSSEYVTVTATATVVGARVVVSPPDADTDTAGHQVNIVAPATAAAAAGFTTTTIFAAVIATDGTTRNTYTVTVRRPPPPPVTFELPELCTMLDAHGAWSAVTNWDYVHNGEDGCLSTLKLYRPSAAGYHLFRVARRGLVTVRVENDYYTDSVVVIRSADGSTVHADFSQQRGSETRANDAPTASTSTRGPAYFYSYFGATIPLTLDRGAYIIEQIERRQVAAQPRYRIGVWGEHVIAAPGFKLETLTIGDIDMSGFDPETTSYTRRVAADVSTVTVTAAATQTDAFFIITLQDADHETEGHQVNLDADGETEITVIASPPELPGAGRLYQITLTGGSGTATGGSGTTTNDSGTATNDADTDVEPRLSALSVSPGTLTPTFAAAAFDYTVSVGSDVEHLTVAATAVTGTSLVIAAPDADPGTAGHQIDLNAAQPGGNAAQTAFLVIVTTDTKIDSYTVTVTRAAPLSEDATLGSLRLSAGTLDPVFSAGRAGYTAEVATTDARITVTAVPVHASATVAITPADADVVTAGHQVDLAVGANTITVTVTAADGATTKAYDVVVTRVAAASADATLSALSLSEGALSPAFAASATVYSVEVGHLNEHVTVTATATVVGARVVVSPPDADTDTAGHQVNIVAPATAAAAAGFTTTTIFAAVIATDGTTRNTYTVTVRRPPPPPVTFELPELCTMLDAHGAWSAVTNWDYVHNGEDGCLSTLKLYRPSAAGYHLFRVARRGLVTVRVENDYYTDSVVVIRSADGSTVHADFSQQRGSETRANDAPTASTSTRGPAYFYSYFGATIPLTLDRGAYIIEQIERRQVAAQPRYRIGVWGEHVIAAPGFKLETLTIGDIDMSGFDPETTSYTRRVAADVSTVTVTATATQPDAFVIITPQDADHETEGHQVNLDADRETEITVIASPPELPGAGRLYQITLTQLPGTTSPLSTVATLSDLSLDDLDIGTFASADTDYTYSKSQFAQNNEITVTVTATANNGATWTVDPPDADPNTAGHQIHVDGDDTIVVTVTSQDGLHQQSYTIAPAPN